MYSDNCFEFIKELEKDYKGPPYKPYLDVANVPTIGYGTTYYPNGLKVTLDDHEIGENEAENYLRYNLNKCYFSFNSLIKTILNQNQIDALLSFVYNIGVSAFKESTVLKIININPNNPLIEIQMKKWIYITRNGNKIQSKGLINRRNKEVKLYFLKTFLYPQDKLQQQPQ